MGGQRLGDQVPQPGRGGGLGRDRPRRDRHRPVFEIFSDRIGIGPRAGVGIGAASLAVLEQQMIVAADHQASIRQKRQNGLVGCDARVAQHQAQIGAVEQPRQTGAGPFGGVRYGQLRARRLGIGVQGVGRHADDPQRAGAERHVRDRLGVARLSACIDDVADDDDADAPHTADHLRQVRRQIIVVIADIDHGGRQARRLRQEGPVDRAARAHGHDIAVLEDVAVDRDHMRNGLGPNLALECGQQLADPLIGRMHVRDRQHPADGAMSSQGGHSRRQSRSPGDLKQPTA